MGFVALKCPSCGAEIELDDSRDFAFCTYCGTKLVRDKQIIEHRGSVKINHDDEINNLLIRARSLVNQNRIAESEMYYNRVLLLDPANSEAIEGLNRAETLITEPNVIIERVYSRMFNDNVGMNIIVDGEKLGKIKGGETTLLTLPVGKHEIKFKVPLYANNKPIPVTIAGRYNKVSITFKAKAMGKVSVSLDEHII